jgi:VIT1/CCC1 family predicted Fe2+/Mn2+ transporter
MAANSSHPRRLTEPTSRAWRHRLPWAVPPRPYESGRRVRRFAARDDGRVTLPLGRSDLPEAADGAPNPQAARARLPGGERRVPPPDHHRDVAGGWLRPTVFGAMDGLVTNVSLIAGVGGGGVRPHTVLLTGLAGLVAGAFSMATGEWTSVTSQNELVHAEVALERRELSRAPEAEAEELARALADRGVDLPLARQVAEQVGRHPEEALRMHAREELGVDFEELPSPWTAAGSSFLSFAVGAFVPLLPYLAGASVLWISLVAAAVVAMVGGGAVARLTGRPVLLGAFRQLMLGALAAGVTYAVGHAIGSAAAG